MSDRTTFVNIDTLFPQKEEGLCRVCNRNVRPPLQKYCSKYCRQIAEAVTKFFTWNYVKQKILQRDEHTCQRCEEFGGQVDHIVPQSKGGHPFAPTNLQTLCKSCNSMKGTSSIDYRGLDPKHVTVDGEEITLSLGKKYKL